MSTYFVFDRGREVARLESPASAAALAMGIGPGAAVTDMDQVLLVIYEEQDFTRERLDELTAEILSKAAQKVDSGGGIIPISRGWHVTPPFGEE